MFSNIRYIKKNVQIYSNVLTYRQKLQDIVTVMFFSLEDSPTSQLFDRNKKRK